MIASEGSLLQQTIASFESQLVARRMHVLVSARDEPRAHDQLGVWPDVHVVTLPVGHMPTCALLLMLTEILVESPHAEIVVVSANRYVAAPRPFVAALARAHTYLGLVPAVLVGVAVDEEEARREWLLPGAQLGEEVFVLVDAQRPENDAERAVLRARGAMQNTSAFVARGSFLQQVLARALPALAGAITKLWRMGRPDPREVALVLGEITCGTPGTDLDGLLLREIGSLAVARVEGAGFSEWRTPRQVFDSLRNPSAQAWLRSRLGGEGRTSQPAQAEHNAEATERAPAQGSWHTEQPHGGA
jgi:mannose-1-phosphate guanylyltransferase